MGLGFQRNGFDGGVGRSDDSVVVPRDDEQDPPVGRFRNNHRDVTGKESTWQNDVHTLAGRQHLFGARFVHHANRITEWTGRVDDSPCRNGMRFTRLTIFGHDAIDFTARVFGQIGDGKVVQKTGTLFIRGACHADQQSRVIKLPVVIDDAAVGLFLLDRRHSLKRLLLIDGMRPSKTVPGCQKVVDLQTNRIVHPFPTRLAGNQKRHVVHQVRCVVSKQCAFF